MRNLTASIMVGAALLGSTLAIGSVSAARRTPDERLAQAITGRVAGAPVDCIYLRDIRSSQIIDGKAIVYDTGRTLYVNSPDSGATSLRSSDVLVTDTHSSQLCSIDIVRLYDSSSRFFTGSVGLGKFVPYTKPPKG
jgi:hypothetical protein